MGGAGGYGLGGLKGGRGAGLGGFSSPGPGFVLFGDLTSLTLTLAALLVKEPHRNGNPPSANAIQVTKQIIGTSSFIAASDF